MGDLRSRTPSSDWSTSIPWSLNDMFGTLNYCIQCLSMDGGGTCVASMESTFYTQPKEYKGPQDDHCYVRIVTLGVFFFLILACS